MTEHLSDEQIVRYRQRRLLPKDLIRTDDHLVACDICRERLASGTDLRAALSRSGGAALEHLTYDQLEALVDGRMSRAEQKNLRAHVDSCRACAEELNDLERFKAELVGFEGQAGHSQKEVWKAVIFGWLTPLRASAVAAVCAVILLFMIVGKRWEVRSHNAVSDVARQTAPPVSDKASSRTTVATALAFSEIRSLPSDDQRMVREAIERGTITPPGFLAELRASPETLLGTSPANLQFAVLDPVGRVVFDPRPLFRWQPLNGATAFSVLIFDSRLNPVQSSPPLRATQWKPSRPLDRGRLYEWQVTARMSDGGSVIAPQPPNPEAKFLVLDQRKADELEQFRQANPNDHIVLGVLYAQAGLPEEGEKELSQITESDSSYTLAQQLLRSVRELQHPSH